MKKKILAITILALLLCLTLAFSKPVMASENCSTGGCSGDCSGENCTTECCPFKIGETCYPTLQSAIDKAQSGETIKLQRDVLDGTGFRVNSGKNIIIDFGGFHYNVKLETGSLNNSCQLLKGATVTLKNGTLESSDVSILVYNFSNLTLENMKLNAKKEANGSLPYALSVCDGTVELKGATSISSTNVALEVDMDKLNDEDGAQVVIDSSGTISGKIGVTGSGSDDDNSLGGSLTIKNVTHEGEFEVSDNLSDNVEIDNGSFESDVTKYVKDNDLVVSVKDNGGENFYVGNDVDTALKNVDEGSTITVTQGDLNLENLPNNVNVINSGSGNVTVNGQEVPESGINTNVFNRSDDDLQNGNQIGNGDLDNTPKTGIMDVTLIAAMISIFSVIGIIIIKKLSK